MILIGRTIENVQIYHGTVILLLQELGFAINLKKLVMTPSEEMEFLGMVINSKEMAISLPEEELQKVKLRFVDLYQSPQVSILQLIKLLEHLKPTIQAALPARQSFPPATANSSLERKEVLSNKYNFEQQLETGASMEDKQF